MSQAPDDDVAFIRLTDKLDREKNGYDLSATSAKMAHGSRAKLTVDATAAKVPERLYNPDRRHVLQPGHRAGFPRPLAIAWRAIKQCDCDILDDVASQMEVLNARAAQSSGRTLSRA